MIAAIISGIALVLIAFFWLLISGKTDRNGPPIAAFFAVGMGLIGGCAAGIHTERFNQGREQGQIDALKGNQTYEIHYVYPKGSSIPSDTLYLKIED
jgi:hypothetical protein